MSYFPLTDSDKKSMLQIIGIDQLNDVIKDIPAVLKNPKMNLPEALSELEIQRLLLSKMQLNTSTQSMLSFLGGGCYDHFVPAAVAQLLARSEFYTAYTPYQAEASQGTLQSIFEYQSLIAELTGLDVSNASHYDGATALAEAVLLAIRHTDRTKILISKAVHPHYRETVKTYLRGSPYQVIEFSFNSDGQFQADEFHALLNPQVAGVVFQTPNFFGVIEDLTDISDTVHSTGGMLILCSNPLSLGLLKSPGQWGADIAVGDVQPFGILPQLGGPSAGYFAVTKALMRRIPGRLVGITEDSKGRRAYVLTLTAREQHIRRERASSNICSNQALCALAACMTLTFLGKGGIQELAELNMDRAHYLKTQIAKHTPFKVSLPNDFFNEFVIESSKPAHRVLHELEKKNIWGGIDLSSFYPHMTHRILVCATETKTKEDLDTFVQALKKC